MTNKDKTNSNSSTRKGIRFDNELLKAIDKKRGGKPLGTWVQDVCAQHLKPVHTPVHTEAIKTVRTPSLSTTNKKPLISAYSDVFNKLPRNVTKDIYDEIIKLSNQGLTGPAIGINVSLSKSSVNRVIQLTKVSNQ